MARYWGFWTVGKLDLLRRYVHAFNVASKGPSERLYLDLFGGQPENLERGTNAPVEGSARIALADSDPGFTRLRFFEMEPHATELRDVLQRDFPERDFQVIAGDCNETLPGVLDELRQLNWAPTFAFVDPNGPDVKWSTLELLAHFKRTNSKKVEIWLLLAAGMFIRNLPRDGRVRDEDANKLDELYGTGQWREIYEARVRGDLEPSAAREEYVNLMRWRLQEVLGYRWTHPLEIFNEQGKSIYHMIFATDHPAGDRIMRNLYGHAMEEFPKMREAARDRARPPEREPAQGELFTSDVGSTAPPPPPRVLYEYVEPWPPYGALD